ncbi:FAD/FMN-containing dehydrogenase [Kitasatospora sp. MAP12-15]|uniref:FAD-binding oxidoreductase n=1 Tax=unclassified Kitasatospora TaxID=2633591 RepID=UPI002474A226|nr:FAD-binding oxidoreductase [Kitasatospora sp. MAP12-44]MDH6115298.1 FAD/FMN-containing dehydrogenase [Kitasatospora sp. MAP12-44]
MRDSSGDQVADPTGPGPERRQLLRFGMGAAAAAALAGCSSAGRPAGSGTQTGTGAAGASARPSTPRPGSATSPSTASTASAGPADWAALAKDLSGPVVLPGDSRYAAAGRLYQPQFDTVRPGGIAYAASAQDVVTALAFARRYAVPVALRSGGHSYPGWSSGTGLVLDVSELNAVSASAGSATVGAGSRLIDVYTGLAARGVTIPAGSCPSVGVAGLTLGGGIGVTSRAYGLTCDSLTGAQVVTADGRILRVDAQAEPDLFWALRGGGGGNFGVVTSLDFRTSPAVDCAYGFLSWPWSSAAKVVEAWQQWAPTAPDQLWADLHLLTWPDGRLQVTSTVNYLGSQAELANQISRLAVPPGTVSLHSASYLATMQVMGGVSGWSQAAAHLPGSLPGHSPQGRLTRESYAARSDFYNRAISGSGIAALVAAVQRYARTVPQGGSAAVTFDALGGAVNRVAPGDTAFVHRDALFIAQYIANYPDPGAGSGPAVDQSRSWLQDVWSTMRPYASGEAYQNYLDPQLAGWQQAYYGANLARLRQVKQAYDPQGLFRFPQALPGS